MLEGVGRCGELSSLMAYRLTRDPFRNIRTCPQSRMVGFAIETGGDRSAHVTPIHDDKLVVMVWEPGAPYRITPNNPLTTKEQRDCWKKQLN
jgi:hypothetical protein